jgi:hypothetical protein
MGLILFACQTTYDITGFLHLWQQFDQFEDLEVDHLKPWG